MTVDDEGAETVRAHLDQLADTAPPVHFTTGDVLRRGRRRRQVRRGVVMTGAATALALVVAVPTVALRDDGTGTPVTGSEPTPVATTPVATTPGPTRPSTPTLTPSPTGSPEASPAGSGPTVSPITGLSPAEAERIARGCARSFGGDDGTVNPTPGPTSAGPRLQDVAGVYAVVRDAVGSHALVYATGTYLSCEFGGSPVEYNAGGATGDESVTEWLPGVLAVDGSSAAEGGQPRKGTVGGPGSPGYYLAEGRVSSAVARVVVSFGGEQATFRPQNRAFLVRLVFSSTWKPAAADTLVITAYDRSGRLLTTYDQDGPQPCYRTPDGQVISGKYEVPTPDCKVALPWQ